MKRVTWYAFKNADVGERNSAAWTGSHVDDDLLDGLLLGGSWDEEREVFVRVSAGCALLAGAGHGAIVGHVPEHDGGLSLDLEGDPHVRFTWSRGQVQSEGGCSDDVQACCGIAEDSFIEGGRGSTSCDGS